MKKFLHLLGFHDFVEFQVQYQDHRLCSICLQWEKYDFRGHRWRQISAPMGIKTFENYVLSRDV